MGAPGVVVAFCDSRACLWFGDATGAAGAAFAGASFARCSRSFVTPRYRGAALSGRFDLLGAVGCVEACDELILQGEAFGEPFGEPVDPGGQPGQVLLAA